MWKRFSTICLSTLWYYIAPNKYFIYQGIRKHSLVRLCFLFYLKFFTETNKMLEDLDSIYVYNQNKLFHSKLVIYLIIDIGLVRNFSYFKFSCNMDKVSFNVAKQWLIDAKIWNIFTATRFSQTYHKYCKRKCNIDCILLEGKFDHMVLKETLFAKRCL